MQSLEVKVKQREVNDSEIEENAMRKDFVDADGAMPSGHVPISIIIYAMHPPLNDNCYLIFRQQ